MSEIPLAQGNIATNGKFITGLSNYLITQSGRVISYQISSKGKEIFGGTDKNGYIKISLVDDTGKQRHFRKSALVCIAFHGPRPPGKIVRHLDGTRTNDSFDNLIWGTQIENCADKIRHGTSQCGEKNPRAKLNLQQVKFIMAHPEISGAELGRTFSVSRITVSAIRRGRLWSKVLSQSD